MKKQVLIHDQEGTPMPNYKGRNKGSKNRKTISTSANLKDVLLELTDKTLKTFPVITPERKVSELRKLIERILNKCSPAIREEVADILFIAFKPQLLKMLTYFHHVPIDKKFQELRMLLPLLKPKDAEELSEYLASKIPKRIK